MSGRIGVGNGLAIGIFSMLRKNAIFLIIEAVVVSIARFSSNWGIAYFWDPQTHGRFVVVFSLLSLLIMLADMGMSATYGVREIALAAHAKDDQLGRLIGQLMASMLAVALAISMALFLFANWIANALGADSHLLRLAAFWPLGYIAWLATVMVANGLQKMIYSLISTIFFYGTWFVILCLAVFYHWSLEQLFRAWLVGVLGGGGVCFVGIYWGLRRIKTHLRFHLDDFGHLIKIIRHSLPYLASQLGTAVVSATVAFLIARLRTKAELSVFQICFMLSLLIHLIAIPVGNAVIPQLATLLERGQQSDLVIVKKLMIRVVLMLGGVAILFLNLSFLGGPYVLNSLDSLYGEHQNLLLLLVVVASVEAIRIMLDRMILCTAKRCLVTYGEIARAISLPMVGVLLIPTQGVFGAGLAVAASAMLCIIFRLVAVPKMFRQMLVILFAVIVVALLGVFLLLAYQQLMLNAILSVALLVACFYFSKCQDAKPSQVT